MVSGEYSDTSDGDPATVEEQIAQPAPEASAPKQTINGRAIPTGRMHALYAMPRDKLVSIYNSIAQERGIALVRTFPSKPVAVDKVDGLLEGKEDVDLAALVASAPATPPPRYRAPAGEGAPKGEPQPVNELGTRGGTLKAAAWDFWKSAPDMKLYSKKLSNYIYGPEKAATTASSLVGGLVLTARAEGRKVTKGKDDDGVFYQLHSA